MHIIFCPLSPGFSMLGHRLLMFLSPPCIASMHKVALLPPVFPAFPQKTHIKTQHNIPFLWPTTLSSLLSENQEKSHYWRIMIRTENHLVRFTYHIFCGVRIGTEPKTPLVKVEKLPDHRRWFYNDGGQTLNKITLTGCSNWKQVGEAWKSPLIRKSLRIIMIFQVNGP